MIKTIKYAWKIVLKYYQWDKLDTKYKKDEFDPVTQADIESERYINQKIRENFPNDKILSEETENKLTDFNGRVRMVDPLDWTKDFVGKWGRFSIIIWLCIDWKPEVWVVFCPATWDVYYARNWKWSYIMNDKTTIEPRKLQVNKISKISESTYFSKWRFSWIRKVNEDIEEALKFKKILDWGSIGMILWEMASWKWECHILTNNNASKRDSCGPQVILEEAGWTVTDVFWKKIDYLTWTNKLNSLVVATNGLIHNNVIKETKKIFTSDTK